MLSNNINSIVSLQFDFLECTLQKQCISTLAVTGITSWVTHRMENNNTKQVLTLLWRFWIPCQASSLGIWQRDWEPSGNLALRASGIWLQNFQRTEGNRDSSPGGHTQNLAHINMGDWTKTTCCRGPSVEVWVNRGSKQGWGLLA